MPDLKDIVGVKRNILGEEVSPRTLSFTNEGKWMVVHATNHTGTHVVGIVWPNGWTGKSAMIDYQIDEPVLTNYLSDTISLGEMKQIITAWEARGK